MGKIRFTWLHNVPLDELQANQRYSRGLGLPEIGSAGAVAPGLAVVGGSPEIRDQVTELRAWSGEIWAINDTWRWCRDHGIQATFYRVDPKLTAEALASIDGVERAVLADTAPPQIFDALLERGAAIELAPLGEGKLWHHSTAAGTAPFLAQARGHEHVTFFGCESSFGSQTHAYKAERPNLMWVCCGGREYVTSPQMLGQAEWLAEAARGVPGFISIAGGGLLAALARHGDYELTHICRALHDTIQRKGDTMFGKHCYRMSKKGAIDEAPLPEDGKLPRGWYATVQEAQQGGARKGSSAPASPDLLTGAQAPDEPNVEPGADETPEQTPEGTQKEATV